MSEISREKLEIKKEKLPKGYSYPLKTSMLLPAFEELPEDFGVILNYYHEQKQNQEFSFGGFEVFYWERQNRTLFIRIYSVYNRDRKRILEQYQWKMIPELKRWLDYLVSLPRDSTLLSKDPYFSSGFSKEKLKMSFSPPLPKVKS